MMDEKRRLPKVLRRSLTDRGLVKEGFHRFAGSAKLDNGRSVFFTYPSGAKYKVPLEFVLQWFEPIARGNSEFTPCILKTRRMPDPHFVRLYLSDGSTKDVSWDTVLMACEPLYEHYGGLTEQSRELVRQWSDQGPFRVEE